MPRCRSRSLLDADDRRILCAEDEPAIASAIRDALVREGHAVDVVARGDEALDWVRACPYDTVILDLVLLGAADRGMTALRGLRSSLSGPVGRRPTTRSRAGRALR